jgi:hypothetical protein
LRYNCNTKSNNNNTKLLSFQEATKEIVIPGKLTNLALDLYESMRPYWSKIVGKDKYIFSSTSLGASDAQTLSNAYRDGSLVPNSWDEYVQRRFMVYFKLMPLIWDHDFKVYVVNSDDEKHYTCNCREGSKKHVCKHAVVAMLKSGLLEIQNAEPLQGLGKRGRTPKMKKQNRFAKTQDP